MAGPPNGVPLATFSFALSAGCLVLWAVILTRRRFSRFATRTRSADGPVGGDRTGHEITDPWLEYLLREAFAEFDRELRKIMPRLYSHDPDDT
jgi:hypothetical protein